MSTFPTSPGWAEEYERENYLLSDPVIQEMEHHFKTGDHAGFIFWDTYQWALSEKQRHVVDRRCSWGLAYGCSVFANSRKKDFAFLLSFASRATKPDARIAAMTTQIVGQLLIARKRLVMQELVCALTGKEARVAAEMVCGRTNGEISLALNITKNTVKFHLKNIFEKLHVNNRQQAIAVLLAERYLGL